MYDIHVSLRVTLTKVFFAQCQNKKYFLKNISDIPLFFFLFFFFNTDLCLAERVPAVNAYSHLSILILLFLPRHKTYQLAFVLFVFISLFLSSKREIEVEKSKPPTVDKQPEQT